MIGHRKRRKKSGHFFPVFEKFVKKNAIKSHFKGMFERFISNQWWIFLDVFLEFHHFSHFREIILRSPRSRGSLLQLLQNIRGLYWYWLIRINFLWRYSSEQTWDLMHLKGTRAELRPLLFSSFWLILAQLSPLLTQFHHLKKMTNTILLKFLTILEIFENFHHFRVKKDFGAVQLMTADDK